MRITRIDGGVRILAPCKINPYLAVLGRRGDGFHDLATVMVAVDLCDAIDFRRASKPGIRLRTSTEPPWSEDWPAHEPRLMVPVEGNLVSRAFHETSARLGVAAACEIELRKSIPVQAGLGGGSSDAAAAILAAFALSGAGYDPSLAAEIAAGLGSDVNFFLEGWAGGTWAASCSGRGERVLPLAAGDGTDWLLVFPDVGCDTGAVFRSLALPAGSPIGGGGEARCEAAAAAIGGGNTDAIRQVLFNGLSDAARGSNRRLDEIWKAVVGAAKGLGVTLSGSGSTIVLPCPPEWSALRAARLSEAVQCPVRVARLWKTEPLADQLDGVRGP